MAAKGEGKLSLYVTVRRNLHACRGIHFCSGGAFCLDKGGEPTFQPALQKSLELHATDERSNAQSPAIVKTKGGSLHETRKETGEENPDAGKDDRNQSPPSSVPHDRLAASAGVSSKN